MATKITAYKTDDNQIFETERDALKHNAELALLPVLGGNIGLVNEVLNNIGLLFSPLALYHEHLTYGENETTIRYIK